MSQQPNPLAPLTPEEDQQGFLQRLVTFLQNPSFQNTAGTIASAIKGPEDLRSFQQQQALGVQAQQRQSQEEQRQTENLREQERLDLLKGQDRRSARTSASQELRTRVADNPLLSLEELKAASPQQLEVLGEKSFKGVYTSAVKPAAAELRRNALRDASDRLGFSTAQLSSLVNILEPNPDGIIPPRFIQSETNPDGLSSDMIAGAREIARQAQTRGQENSDLTKAQMFNALNSEISPGASLVSTDLETGVQTIGDTAPAAPLKPSASAEEFQRNMGILRDSPETFAEFSDAEIINFLTSGKLPTDVSGDAITRAGNAVRIVSGAAFAQLPDDGLLGAVQAMLANDPEALAVLPSIVVEERPLAPDIPRAITPEREEQLRTVSQALKGLPTAERDSRLSVSVEQGELTEQEAGIMICWGPPNCCCCWNCWGWN